MEKRSVANKIVLGIMWLIAHIVLLVLLIIFSVKQIMAGQSPEWIAILLICCCATTILTVIPVIFLRDWIYAALMRKENNDDR